MKFLGRLVFDLASEDAKEFQEIMKFFETWLRDRNRFCPPIYLEDTSRGSDAEAVEDDDGADVESSTPVAKKIKLFDH